MIPIDPDAEYVSVGVRSFGKGVFHYPPRPGADLGKLRFFEVKPGCLFISNIKAWEGAIAVASEDDAGCVASNRFLPYFGETDTVDVDYLHYYFAVGPGLVLVQKASPGSADRNRTLSMSQFERLRLPLPPLPEQKKIAAILSSVDEAIQATQAVIEQTRRVKEGLLQDLLTRGIGHTRFKQTEIGEIPESWEVRKLGGIVDKSAIQNGLYRPASDYAEQGFPIIRIDSFQHGGVVDLSDLRRLAVPEEEIDRYWLQDDDIVLNRVNSLSHLAKSSIVRGVAEPTVFESNMMRLRLPDDSGLLPGFLIAVLALPYAWDHFQLRAKKAVAQASVNQGDVMALPVPVPPKDEQRQIERVLVSVGRRVEADTATLRQHEQVKSGLLQDLLTGKVRVSV